MKDQRKTLSGLNTIEPVLNNTYTSLLLIIYICPYLEGGGGGREGGGREVLRISSDVVGRMEAKIKTQKNSSGFQQNPENSLDQKLTPKSPLAEFLTLKMLNIKNIGNRMFVYSSRHLNLSFFHLVVILTTIETPKNTSSVLYSQTYTAKVSNT